MVSKVQFEKIALSFDAAEKGTSYGHPAIVVTKKFFTRHRKEDNSAVLFVGSLDEREMLMEVEPAVEIIAPQHGRIIRRALSEAPEFTCRPGRGIGPQHHGVRATAAMISYELAEGLTLVGIIMTTGTMSLMEIVEFQGGYWLGVIPKWFCFSQPLAFVIFLIAVRIQAQAQGQASDIPSALTLENAIQLAVDRNPALAAAKNEIQAAEGDRIAAGKRPKFSASPATCPAKAWSAPS